MLVRYFVKGKSVKVDEMLEPIDFAISVFLAQWGLQNEKATILVDLHSDELSERDGVAATAKLDENLYQIAVNAKHTQQKELDYSSLFIVFAHEIVHVKQHHNNELHNQLVLNENQEWVVKQTWKGQDVSHIPYEKLPHEKEANKYQYAMVSEFFKELDLLESAIS